MPITKKETFTMRDVARETRITDNEFLKYFEHTLDPRTGEIIRKDKKEYDLRTINTFCNINKLDSSIIGFPAFPINPSEPYIPSLRSYRNYNRVKGMYAYNWTEMYIAYTDTTHEDLVYNNWLGHWSVPFNEGVKYVNRMYITLPGFKGWHIPTKGELDLTIAANGGYNQAGYYLKKGKINNATNEQWEDGNWASPNNALEGRRLGFLPSGTLNANGDIRNMQGKKSFYPYVLVDQQGDSFWDTLMGERITGIYKKDYEDENGNKKKINGYTVETLSNYVFSMENNKITVETGRLTQRAQTVRLVRDQSNSATSFVDIEGNEYGTYTVNGVTWMDRDVCCSYESIYDDCKEKPFDRATFRTIQPTRYSDLIYDNDTPQWPWYKDKSQITSQYGFYVFGQSGGRFPELNIHNSFEYPHFAKVIVKDNEFFPDKYKYILTTTPGYKVIPFYIEI